jgi:hypothetical protein
MAQHQNAPSGVLFILARQGQLGSETLLTVNPHAAELAQRQAQPYHLLYTFHLDKPEEARRQIADCFGYASVGRQHRYRMDASAIAFAVFFSTGELPELLIGEYRRV